MGQAKSRTKPSIVAFEALARSPAIEVLCGVGDAARTETIPQPASKQILKNRLIGSPLHSASISCEVTALGGAAKSIVNGPPSRNYASTCERCGEGAGDWCPCNS